MNATVVPGARASRWLVIAAGGRSGSLVVCWFVKFQVWAKYSDMSTAVMNPPIAGVVPPEFKEAVVMTVYPSIGGMPLGRWLGRLYKIGWGWGVFTVGHVIALLSIPLATFLVVGRFIHGFLADIQVLGIGKFFSTFIPASLIISRYTLTNRRVVVQRGLKAIDESWVELDRFDTIEVEVLPGQEWYHAGNLIFRRGPIETFRLDGVSRPETFRQTCLKARAGYVGVRQSAR